MFFWKPAVTLFTNVWSGLSSDVHRFLLQQAVNEAAAQVCRILPTLLFHRRELSTYAKQVIRLTEIDFAYHSQSSGPAQTQQSQQSQQQAQQQVQQQTTQPSQVSLLSNYLVLNWVELSWKSVRRLLPALTSPTVCQFFVDWFLLIFLPSRVVELREKLSGISYTITLSQQLLIILWRSPCCSEVVHVLCVCVC